MPFSVRSGCLEKDTKIPNPSTCLVLTGPQGTCFPISVMRRLDPMASVTVLKLAGSRHGCLETTALSTVDLGLGSCVSNMEKDVFKDCNSKFFSIEAFSVSFFGSDSEMLLVVSVSRWIRKTPGILRVLSLLMMLWGKACDPRRIVEMGYLCPLRS